jgi:hypothetical protein
MQNCKNMGLGAVETAFGRLVCPLAGGKTGQNYVAECPVVDTKLDNFHPKIGQNARSMG